MTLHTIGIAPVRLVGSNAGRRTLSLTNRSLAGQVIYISDTEPGGLVIANASFVLGVGDYLHFGKVDDGNDVKHPWSAIATAAGAVLYLGELSEPEAV